MHQLKIIIFFWQCEIIDSLTLLQFCLNCRVHYTGLTVSEAAGYINAIGLSARLAPKD